MTAPTLPQREMIERATEYAAGVFHSALFAPVPTGYVMLVQQLTLAGNAVVTPRTELLATIHVVEQKDVDNLHSVMDVTYWAAWDRRQYNPPLRVDEGQRLHVIWYLAGAGKLLSAGCQYVLQPTRRQ